jgi:Domain of Unknown Function (DUF1259)
MRCAMCFLVTLLLVSTWSAQSPSTANPWKAVEEQLGRTGSVQPGDVYKVGLPRTDLHVRVGDVEIKPALALGGWVAFKETGHGAMVMGDLVLTEDEVAPVTAKLQAAGIEQTAIHNHVLHESPRVIYMHVGGQGNAAELAKALHDALAVSKLPPAAPSKPSELVGLDQQQVEQALGRKGKVNGGVLQFSVPRAGKITDDGMEVPPAMGTATALNFQPTGGGKAAITGDFVLVAAEVNPVIRVLNENGIAVTALHSHMLTESPRLFFMHFWANADALKLSGALRDALQKTDSATQTAR